MADTYTQNLEITKPELSVPNWGDKMNNNLDYLDYALMSNNFSEYYEHDGLDFYYNNGRVANGTTVTQVSAGHVSLTDNDTNYVEVNLSGTVSSNITGFTIGSIPLFEVVTVSGSITTVTDKRAYMGSQVNAELEGIGGLSGTGFVVHTASGTYLERTITGTADEIEVLNGDGVSQNPTISLPSAITTKLGYIDQDVQTTASPTFAGLTLSGLTANSLISTDGSKELETPIPIYNGGSLTLIIGTTPASASGANYNVGLGNVFNTLIDGDANTAIGRSVMTSLTSGGNNTAVGATSLLNITTTSDNTAIGEKAGRYYSTGTGTLTTPAQSIFIGASSRASADGVSNEIVIGYNAVANGTNTATLGNTSTNSIYMGSTQIINQSVTTTANVSFGTVDCGSSCEADAYTVGGTAGVDYSGLLSGITNITISKGIITAVS